MESETKQILQMVSEGKLSVEEAHRILEAMDQQAQSTKVNERSKSPRVFRLKVTEGDNVRVNLSVPTSLARVLWKLIPRDTVCALNAEGVTLDSVLAMVNTNEIGNIINVDAEDGTRVEISVE